MKTLCIAPSKHSQPSFKVAYHLSQAIYLSQMLKRNHLVEKIFLLTGLVLFCVFVAKAVAQNVTQGYQSEATLQKGIIVQLKKGDGSKVEPLTQTSDAAMLGVVVSASDAPVSLSSNADTQQVFVANYGRYDVLVSNQNGSINSGDYITISSVNGVGMKAQAAQTVVLGKALASFDGQTKVESTANLVDSLGNKRSVTLGRIPVDISISRNPLFQPESPPGVPRILEKAAQIVTTRPVGAVRIYASLGVLLLSVIIAGSILFAGVRSGMTAIGRNPLAKHSIMRNLITVTLIALIIVTVGLLAVYLLLRL